MQTQEQTNATGNIQNVLPLIPAGAVSEPTPEQKAELLKKQIAEAQAKQETAMARFNSTVSFKLESEVIGRSIKKTVSKNGAVSIGLKSQKDLAVVSGMKGEELAAFMRMRRDELKGEQGALAMKLAGDIGWTGHGVKLSAKGDKITLEWKKAAPEKVSLSAEPTDEQMAKLLGITPEAVKAMKEMAKTKAEAEAKAALEAKAKQDADDKAAQELADEAAAIAEAAKSNGEVHQPEEQPTE